MERLRASARMEKGERFFDRLEFHRKDGVNVLL